MADMDERELDGLTRETVELPQTMIRNECVNDGTPGSGSEVRNADVLQTLIEGAGVEVERFEPTPGRVSIVGRIEGSDPGAPSLCLMGHTDVVPVHADGWHNDPFGGELIQKRTGLPLVAIAPKVVAAQAIDGDQNDIVVIESQAGVFRPARKAKSTEITQSYRTRSEH